MPSAEYRIDKIWEKISEEIESRLAVDSTVMQQSVRTALVDRRMLQKLRASITSSRHHVTGDVTGARRPQSTDSMLCSMKYDYFLN